MLFWVRMALVEVGGVGGDEFAPDPDDESSSRKAPQNTFTSKAFRSLTRATAWVLGLLGSRPTTMLVMVGAEKNDR